MKFKTALFFIIAAGFSVQASVNVTQSTKHRLTFMFDMQDYSITSRENRNGAYSKIDFSDANMILPNENGYILPCKSFHVGVPNKGKVSVQFASMSVKRIKLVHPPELIDEKVKEEEGSFPVFENPWVSEVEYVHFRDMRTAHFFIRPFIYNSETQTLTVLLKGSCTITFPKSKTRSAPLHINKSDYYNMVEDMVLNFNVAKNWITQRRRVSPSRIQADLPVDGQMKRFRIGDGVNDLNDCFTNENRIIRINPDDVPLLRNKPINSICMYASVREELDSIVPDSVINIPDGLTEIPLLRFERGKRNYKFDGDDYILAYVTGICDWYYDTSVKDFEFSFNRIDKYRYYRLGRGGTNKTIQKFVQPVQASGISFSTYEDRLRFQKSLMLKTDRGNVPKGGKNWVWNALYDGNRKFALTPALTSLDTTLGGFLRIGFGYKKSLCTLTVSIGDSVFKDTIPGDSAYKWIPLKWVGNPEIVIRLATPALYYEIKNVDIRYFRSLNLDSTEKRLRIYSPPDSGIVKYNVGNLPLNERILLLRIPPDESQISIVTDTIITNPLFRVLSWKDTSGIGIQYFLSTESAIDTALQFDKDHSNDKNVANEFEIRRLRYGVNNQADYMIITSQEFIQAANDLATHKDSIGFPNSAIVDVDEIFWEFSGGNHDPAAIRNFLFYTYNSANWTQGPEYVLLLGNGNYDYKGYSTDEINHIPIAQFGFKCIEDFFSCIRPGLFVTSDSVFPDMSLGRIPCASKTDAHNSVTKIFDLEDRDADYSAWRHRVLLVSDDDMQGDGKDYIRHYKDNEAVEQIIKGKRPSVEVRKVMLFEYEWNNIYQKPDASSALFREVNDVGVSWLNFFGHGNEYAWCDEAVLLKEQLRNFTNKKKYPVICSFSCSVGRFDDPDKTSMSGEMVTIPDGGAIASVSSSRTAYASLNAQMSKTFNAYFFEKNEPRTLGQAYNMTKAIDNIKYYLILGDPSICFFEISDTVVMDFTTENGDTVIDTLKALQKIIINGKILRGNSINSNFGTAEKPASVNIGLYFPDQDSVTRKDGGKYSDPVYSLPGDPIFVSKNTKVINGRFSQKALLPRRVPFEEIGVSLKAYAWNTSDNKRKAFGTGFRDDFVFSGSEAIDTSDKEGPSITIRQVYERDTLKQWNSNVCFTDKICSFIPLKLEINLYDKNGIDASAKTPDEGFTIEIKGIMPRKNMGEDFTFSGGEYTKGRANLVLENKKSDEKKDIKPGTYEMKISAQDMLGNISKISITIEILSRDNFTIDHVFNHPNPVRMGQSTFFYFSHSNTNLQWNGPVEAEIKIFTLRGRLIKTIRNNRIFNGISWDLTDQRGNKLPPNVYLYKVRARMPFADYSGNDIIAEFPIKKLVIHPPG